MMFQGFAFLLAALYWVLTAFYGVLASQSFIQEQFLAPRLFAPLAFFAEWHVAVGVAMVAPWAGMRLLRERTRRVIAAIVTSTAGVALIALTAPLSGAQTATTSLTVVAVGLSAMVVLAVAEWRPSASASPSGSDSPADHSLADLSACLLAATSAAVAQMLAAFVVAGAVADRVGSMAHAGSGAAVLFSGAQSLRLHLLLGAAAFLCLAVVRALSDVWTARRVMLERVLTGVVMAAALAAFLYFVVLASISLRGAAAAAIASALGAAVAFAVIARGAQDVTTRGDGVADAFAALTPKLAERWWGFALWVLVLTAFAAGVSAASRTADWNFALARTGVVITWMLALAGAVAVTRRIKLAAAGLSFATAAAVLVGHLWLLSAAPVKMSAASGPGGRWLSEALAGSTQPVVGADIVDLLHARTNISRGTAVEPVEVNLSTLSEEPVAPRPHIFVFVVDSLRRDYVSPYNPKVTFTPSIAALASDSVVFRNAFTQYGATGLSVPSLWVGGQILHKQYVTPFAPMNSLAKLLAHERYTQWIGMDNIMEVILPASESRERLDRGVAIKDFRMCRTLADIRSRLDSAVPDAPVFVYSLPQDVHVSVVAREGASSIDGQPYNGFYAPVASRVKRLDACLGEFVSDLKTRGLYDDSIIVLTSDHGDSLGEDGRMGHAYSLHPEIVRVPLIVHVPAKLRSQWSWDEQRAAFTTDITPTLYRLLGQEPHAPAEFFGESLAHQPGVSVPPLRDRMVAASYGAVYGALLDGGRRYYVFDAIAMREMAFTIGSDAKPGEAIPVTGDIQQRGLAVIRRTVDDISHFYRYPRSADTGQTLARR